MPETDPPALTARMADAIRFLALDAVERATDGHPGAPLGCAEIAVALPRHLKCDPADPEWPDRDRFVLSNGHGSMLLYAALHLAGYAGISMDQIRRFREFGARTHGHPEIAPELGIEAATGPLGQGIANAVGMAVAEAKLADAFGSGLVDHRTYALVGDGCLQEGIAHDVISLAGHLRLGKRTVLWDDNRITDDGATDLSISEDVRARYRHDSSGSDAAALRMSRPLRSFHHSRNATGARAAPCSGRRPSASAPCRRGPRSRTGAMPGVLRWNRRCSRASPW